MPFFSVIVPVFNMEKYLPDCLSSVLAQDYTNYELLLVDDGSTDGSGRLCDQYAEKYNYIKVFHQKNAGLSAARNTGLLHAKGKYILFLDSDDYYIYSNFFIQLKACVEKHEPQVLCFSFQRVPETRLAAPGQLAFPAADGCVCYTPADLVSRSIYQSSACIKLLERCFLDKYMLRFPPGKLSEDVPFSATILLHHPKMVYFPAAAYGYRVRKGSITSAISPRHLYDLLQALESLAEVPTENDAYLSFLAYQYCTLLINWRRGHSPTERHFLQRLKGLKWLLRHNSMREVRLVSLCYRLLGLRVCSRLLWLYYGFFRRRQ